jgi:hypothetical protein
MTAVAQSLQGLNAAWFAEVLGLPVKTVTVERIAVSGAVADMARVRLEYADGDGPASVIAKIRGTTEVQAGMDAAMGLYDREGRLYSDLAAELPIGTPRCFHVGDGTTTPLLLEDLGDLRMGDQMVGLTLDDAEALMDALGDLHAAYWNAPLLQQDWLASPSEGVFAGMIVQLVGSGVPALQERYAGRVPDAALEAVAQLAPRWGEVLAACAQGPHTLVHNDCRLDNIFFADDGRPLFVDWQVVARTRGTQDVGNLLAGSMDSADLAAHWESLLKRYHERLTSAGVDGYDWDTCREHYRQNILYPLGAGMALLGSMAIDDDRGLGDAIVMRALTHCADLDAFSAV